MPEENISEILKTGDLGLVPTKSILQGAINNGNILGNTSATWNPRSGGNSKLIVKGTQINVYTLAKECQELGYEYSITGGAIFTIEITIPVDVITNDLDAEPDPISFWELNYHQIDRSVLEMGDRKFISSLSSDTTKQIEQKLKNPLSATPVVKTKDHTQFANATLAYNLKLLGIEGRAEFVPTLKRNAVVSSKYNKGIIPGWNEGTFLNGSVMTTEDLLIRYNSPSNPLSEIPLFIKNQLPRGLDIFDVYDNSPNPIKFRSGFVTSKNGIVSFIGWLQYPIESQQVAINKIQVSQTWVFNQWSAGDFGLYDVYDINDEYNPGPDPFEVIIGIFPP